MFLTLCLVEWSVCPSDYLKSNEQINIIFLSGVSWAEDQTNKFEG